jgi:hypothetical protein
MKNQLFLLSPGFSDPDYPDTRFFCTECAELEGLLSYEPRLARELEVLRIAFPRPRAEVVALVGEKNQSLPLLVLAEGAEAHDAVTGAHGGWRFVSGRVAIGKWLHREFGIPVAHP